MHLLRRLITFLAALALVSLIGLYIFDATLLNAPFWEERAQSSGAIPTLSTALPELLAGKGPDATTIKPYLQAALTPDYVTAKFNQTIDAASDYLHAKTMTALVDFADLIPRLEAQGYNLPTDQVTQFDQPVDLTPTLAKPAPIIHSLLRWKTLGIPVVLLFLGLVFVSAAGHHRWRRLAVTAIVAAVLLGLSALFWEVVPRILVGLVPWGDTKALAAPATKLVGAVSQGVAILNIKAAVGLGLLAGAGFGAHFLHPLIAHRFRHKAVTPTPNVGPFNRDRPV